MIYESEGNVGFPRFLESRNRMEKWFLMTKAAPFTEIGDKFHIHPVLARIIRNRDIVGDEAINLYLNGTISDLYDGMLLKDVDKAVDILIEKIRDKSHIRIIGDYDIDGINATYILLEGIQKLGGNVDIDIPDRMRDGYGLCRALVDRAYAEGVDTIITCDNGIAAAEEIEYGMSLGMTIIVTDHHEVPLDENEQECLPPANAVIDPKQKDCEYPFKELCGAAVAYKLMEALYEVIGEDAEDLDYLIENVAIATIGDVMPLVDENRIFVKQGLDMLRRTGNYGLKALMLCNDVPQEKVDAHHIGFVLGPCMNATGRLDTAKKSLELLCAQTWQEAVVLAEELKNMNEHRKEMTLAAVEEATELLERTGLKEDKVLVIYMPHCHESLAGIVAGRIKDAYHKPTIVLTKTEDGIKGSARSIDAYNMYYALHENSGLLKRFGGHKLAAGLSMEESKIDTLRQSLNQSCRLEEQDFVSKVSIDLQLPFRIVTEDFVNEMQILEPYGKSNARPLFAEKNVEILNGRVFGSRQNVLKMQVVDGEGTVMHAVCFGKAQDLIKFLKAKYGETQVNQMLRGQRTGMTASFTYYPTINEYMDRKTLQLVIQNYQ